MITELRALNCVALFSHISEETTNPAEEDNLAFTAKLLALLSTALGNVKFPMVFCLYMTLDRNINLKLFDLLKGRPVIEVHF